MGCRRSHAWNGGEDWRRVLRQRWGPDWTDQLGSPSLRRSSYVGQCPLLPLKQMTSHFNHTTRHRAVPGLTGPRFYDVFSLYFLTETSGPTWKPGRQGAGDNNNNNNNSLNLYSAFLDTQRLTLHVYVCVYIYIYIYNIHNTASMGHIHFNILGSTGTSQPLYNL